MTGTTVVADTVVEPHRQLHQSLEATCNPPQPPGRFYTRKHSRTSSFDSGEYDWSSDVSGRFDDAESDFAPKQGSPFTSHSAKRRRSNDWPEDPAHKASSSPRYHRWPFHNYGKGTSSPRPITRRQGRRSRFVEGSMNDSVSEKPPSIFFRDEPRSTAAAPPPPPGNVPGQRNSGIFRFGKAIASAFNPFGVWGNVSDIWKNPQEEKPSAPANDALAQAEKAYAELKKSGYKGTLKGSYLQQQAQADSNHIAEETWTVIQEKMDYKPTGRHSRQDSTETHGTGSSFRNSFHELRKAKSSLGILSSANRKSDESDSNEVRRQKSRKELHRQAKLMKRVSNLEDKLERTRRELQILLGDEGESAQPDATLCQEMPYPRKFVPGALPTLPSERLLQDESVSALLKSSAEQPETEPEPEPLKSMLENVRRSPVQDQGNERRGPTGKRPAKPKVSQQSTEDQTLDEAVDSPSRKRKSPAPQLANTDPTEVQEEEEEEEEEEEARNVSQNEEEKPAVTDATSPPRKPKLPKMVKADSPGSVERKPSQENLLLSEKDTRPPSQKRGRRPTPPSRFVGKRSPSSTARKTSNSRNTTPCLRMKKGRSDLRSGSGGKDDISDDHPDKENHTQHDQVGPDDQPISSASSSPSKSDRPKYVYNYIPPVPPLPKDIAATAAKADQRLAKEIERRRSQKTKGGRTGQTQGPEGPFKWPEDIF
ncbi:velvet protein [Aspergillus nanangensis]|uniref:Velvet protein n=1 Tax=Aspergillus nanangensis TaxID=2582783 RepID=A0AAD4CEK9_ASPNN|nr:velvet protein [Aspergillus nanangensis]